MNNDILVNAVQLWGCQSKLWDRRLKTVWSLENGPCNQILIKDPVMVVAHSFHNESKYLSN